MPCLYVKRSCPLCGFRLEYCGGSPLWGAYANHLESHLKVKRTEVP
jgi:hypothetical protein